jgi:TRAP-type C4-dicarboxylate transport system substrate-binding protein
MPVYCLGYQKGIENILLERTKKSSPVTKNKEVTMIKKACLVVMAVCIVLALSPLGISNAQTGPTIRLTHSTLFPAPHIQTQLIDSWGKEINQRTNGRVIVEIYPGQQLTKATECYEGVVQGKSDLGFSLIGYTAERFPVMGAVDLPLGYTSGKVATAVANEVYRKFKPKELSDTQVMYLSAHGPGFINTRGKAVRRMEDMKGLKLRAHGTSARVVKALGGIAVSAPMPEVYNMVKKGEVFGALFPYEAHDGWKMAEVHDYTTACYSIAYTSTFFVVMNKDKWNALPKDIQLIIEEVNNEWIAQHGEAWNTSDEVGMRVFLEHGNMIIGLDKEESARWKKAVAPVIDDYVKYLNGKGLNGQEIVDFTINTLNSMQ